MRPLVLENGAFEPPKVFVLQGFHVGILLRLEDFALNRAPMLGGDRFFNAIRVLRFRVDFRIDQRFYRKRFRKRYRRRFKKVFEKGVEEDSKLENSSLLGHD